MAGLNIPLINEADNDLSLVDIAHTIKQFDTTVLSHAPWPGYPYKPYVHFIPAHNNKSFFIQFTVEEKEIRAVNNKINNPVYEDSCVEFFIAFDETGYYNFEFNCIGVCLAGFGKNKHERIEIPEETIKEIKAQSIINRNLNEGFINWQLTIEIPVKVFNQHFLQSFSKLNAAANFYKCGDLLTTPHFLAWSNIISDVPNFHLPQYFGNIYFS